MTAKETAERLKHAAMILARYRPAGVRFDEEDRAFARDLSGGWARLLVADGHLAAGRLWEEDIRKAIRQAIEDYATYLGPPLWFRKRSWAGWCDRGEEIPF